MRAAAVALVLVCSVGCSHQGTPSTSPSAKAWKAGSAVVVVTAHAKAQLDLQPLIRREGVISVSQSGSFLKLVLGRQAMAADLAALVLDLRRMPGVTDVQDLVVPPA